MSTRQTKPKPKQGQGRGTLSRAVVLEMSARLFNRRGFDRTSMNDIAHALGVTKPSLYHYFPSKDAILLASIEEAGDVFEEKLRGVLSEARPAFAQLREVMLLYAQGMRSDVFRALVLADERALSKTGRGLVIKAKRRINEAVENLIRRAAEDGAIEVMDPRLASYAIFGMYNWMAVWRRDDWENNTDAIEAAFESMMLYGLTGKVGRGAAPPAASRRRVGA